MPSLDLFLSGQTYKFGLRTLNLGLTIHISDCWGTNDTNSKYAFGKKCPLFVEICITTFDYFAM